MKDKIMKTMLELVAVPSVSGTEEEDLAIEKLYSILTEFPYFQQNAANLKCIPIVGDPLHRRFLAAFYKGNEAQKKAIILTGHSDVVAVEEFGHLKSIAFDGEAFTRRVEELKLDVDALKDLHSGEWIFGRGTADMKYGLAMQIEVLRKLSQEKFEGNILFLAVPGEESNSEGMLAAVPYIEQLQREGYEFAGLLLSECCIPKYSGDESKKIYLGSCGKNMPLFYFVGQEAHVCEPFNGLNPNLMASELNRLIELNTEFCGEFKDEKTPPPVCLKQADLKELYSVQTPLYAYAYYNMLTLDFKYEEFISKLKKTCVQAFKNALEIVKRQRRTFEEASAIQLKQLEIEPTVVYYEEIYKTVKEIEGEKFDLFIEDQIRQWKINKLDNQKIAIQIVKETYEKYPYKKPMIIIAFAPPFYPSRYLDTKSKEGAKFMDTIEDMIQYAQEQHGIKIEKENFFMGICDLCYTGVKDEILDISKNILGLNQNYGFPVKSLSKINIPSIVFGGFGKDFHKYSERLHVPYSMGVVPDLYEHFIHKLFE